MESRLGQASTPNWSYEFVAMLSIWCVIKYCLGRSKAELCKRLSNKLCKGLTYTMKLYLSTTSHNYVHVMIVNISKCIRIDTNWKISGKWWNLKRYDALMSRTICFFPVFCLVGNLACYLQPNFDMSKYNSIQNFVRKCCICAREMPF